MNSKHLLLAIWFYRFSQRVSFQQKDTCVELSDDEDLYVSAAKLGGGFKGSKICFGGSNETRMRPSRIFEFYHKMSEFLPIDQISVNTIRCLAADTVQKANSGHPGAPMGWYRKMADDSAPMAHILFSRFVVTSPLNPKWINRDRFVLSNGHGCVLQ